MASIEQKLQALSADKKDVTIALSAIISAIWAGLWGFNWAASHLGSNQLFVAIMVGLAVGTGMTVYAIERSFKAIKGASGAIIRGQ